MGEAAEEAGVVDLPGQFVIGLFGLILFFVGHGLGGVRLPFLLYEEKNRG
jgi:succinate dehydrogenase/fumarate reductase cytochrome b subunit